MRAFFTDRNVRRLFVLVLFLGVLFLFRHLALMLVFFVIFERLIGSGATFLKERFRVPVAVGVLGLVVLLLGALAGLITFGVTRVVPEVPEIRHDLTLQFVRVRDWLLRHHVDVGERLGAERMMENAQHYAGNVVGFVASTGKNVIYVVMGLVLAIVFLIEHKDLEAWRESLPEDSPPRILVRYVSYLCDAIAITAKLQVIVALVNTVITLPVLIALRLPSIPALMVFLFVMGLIPVVGGVVSGVVMGTLSYIHRGPVGVVVFFVSTFVLHKIESYYLNPRLTAKHVKLPGFVIIASLILFEHVFGLVGLFISFPALYVAAKIREGWRHQELEAEDEAIITQGMHFEKPAPHDHTHAHTPEETKP